MFALAEKIRLGISILDEENPDWHYRVNHRKLDMQYSDTDILGQLYGNFERGRKRLNMTNQQAYEAGFISWFQLKEWFWMPLVGWRLTRAWRQAILIKRASDLIAYSKGHFDNLPRYPLEIEELDQR